MWRDADRREGHQVGPRAQAQVRGLGTVQVHRAGVARPHLGDQAGQLGRGLAMVGLQVGQDAQPGCRGTDCLKAAADKVKWQSRPSPAPGGGANVAKGRGVALTQRANAYAAAVAEIELNKSTGQVVVTRIVCAHDCGLMVNPDGVRNQVEGNVIQGVSRALLEEVGFDSNGVTSLDWTRYPILRFHEVPQVEVVLINRPEMDPLGAGEPATIPAPTAIANAIYDATGVRLREVPFTPQRVLAGLKKA